MRETSTVAPQALTLVNSQEIQDRALNFAASLVEKERPDKNTIDLAFQRSLGRSASPDELAACLDHWQSATEEEKTKAHSPANFPDKIERTVMAEKTGEPYTFTEIMPAYRSYVPDLQPANTDARTRGLAQVCLVIFNLNEFAYVD